jgi:hypothetical protein
MKLRRLADLVQSSFGNEYNLLFGFWVLSPFLEGEVGMNWGEYVVSLLL